jgi:heptosyltransferase-1
MAESPGADRILIIRLGALGDVIRTLPAVASLRGRYPGAQISWLVEPGAAGVLEGHSVVDEVMIFPRDRLERLIGGLRPLSLARELFRIRRVLRAGRFDLVVDFHGILKSGVLARLSGARLRVGYAPPVGREQGWRFLNRRAVLAPGKLSRFDRNEGLVRYLGVAPFGAARSYLELDAVAASRAKARRADAIAVMHPGTSAATPYKRYTVRGYADAARSLYKRSGIHSWVSYGPGPEERAFAEQIVDAAGGAARLAPETPHFSDLKELLAGARVFIGSDSGPLHAASLLGTPVVQILGPTDPVENAPFSGTPSRSLRVALPCSPCRRGCAAASCMRLVPPLRVAEAALELSQGDDKLPDASAEAEGTPVEGPTASAAGPAAPRFVAR